MCIRDRDISNTQNLDDYDDLQNNAYSIYSGLLPSVTDGCVAVSNTIEEIIQAILLLNEVSDNYLQTYNNLLNAIIEIDTTQPKATPLYNLINTAILIEATEALISYDFLYALQAIENIKKITQAIDKQMQIAASYFNDDLFKILCELKSSTYEALESRLLQLPTRVTRNAGQNLTGLVASYEYHGNIQKEQEILDVNNLCSGIMLPKSFVTLCQ